MDWDRLASWASLWHLRPALSHAFASTARELGVGLPAGARDVSSARPRRSERRAMRAYTDRRRNGGVAVATMAAIPGLRAEGGIRVRTRDAES